MNQHQCEVPNDNDKYIKNFYIYIKKIDLSNKGN